jgi:pyruvate/2-oxoglutarate dehydrogenase complex dihydrolipoamide acyltransferase (E2) component
VAGRPASRAVLVAPGAVTHGVDMNQRHVELSVLGRVPGKGLNVRMPASPNIAPPGWYMLFVLDSTGTPSVAHWVQLRAGAPDAPTLTADSPVPPAATPPASPPAATPPAATPPAAAPTPAPAPAADTRAPRASVKARRVRRKDRKARLLVAADEPARITVSVRIGKRLVRARLRIPVARANRTLALRLRAPELRRLRRGHRLALRVTLVARDAHGNAGHRTVGLRLRRAATG